ncbi:MAG: hypothetical protein ACLTDP_07710 [Terrisporobacter sp.]
MDPYYRGIASSSITNWGTEKDVIYKIKFNYEILRKYLDFLIKLFDPLYNNENKEKDKQCFFITINDELRNDELRKTLFKLFQKRISIYKMYSK